MRVLGIETSCDETSAAVVENGSKVLSCVIATSKQDFQRLGGVIPEEAAREQLKSILPVLSETLRSADATNNDIDAIAVTYGPGLLGSLLVGTSTARVLASVWKKPLIGVHHTLGHLSSTWLTDELENTVDTPIFPVLTLSVSGGHTDLWYRRSHTVGKLLGSTRDDAAGEAFDKGAVLLGLPYPGGPMLEKLARGGDAKKFKFPRPLSKEDTLDFSFSGLKTSLKYLLRDMPKNSVSSVPEAALSSIAASYQEAICTHLSHAASTALDRYPETREIHIVGGVAANGRLREHMKTLAETHGIRLRTPSTLRYCTDNGAMIAAAGTFLVAELPASLHQSFETVASQDLRSILSDPS